MTSHPFTLFRSLVVAALVLALSSAPAVGQQAPCELTGSFAFLQAQIPDLAGTCSGPQIDRIELGEITQPTTTGRFVSRSVDGVVSFSDGTSTWVIDPRAEVQVRSGSQRFAWEFNGDGYPLVGQPTSPANGPCPITPIQVLAVENFYGNLVNEIGGQCVNTTTILSDPDADPHEFQLSANDLRAYQGAQLVIEDGLGYDDFSDKALSTLSTQPQVIKAGDVLGLQVGANPHVWYSAGYVDQIRGSILASLKQLAPVAAGYFDGQSAALDREFATYHNLVSQIASTYGNVPVGATESIFVDMAASTGLNLVSPPAFMQAVAEGNEPAARDVAMFVNQITSHQIKVLVYNTQTVTSLTEQIKAMAVQNNIPIVGVSETMPQGANTFQGWQANELELLLQALQKANANSS